MMRSDLRRIRSGSLQARANCIRAVFRGSVVGLVTHCFSWEQGKEQHNAVHQTTRKNPLTAMEGEAFAYATYMLF